MGVQPLRVCQRHPADQIAHPAILGGPNDKMPVTGHEAVSQQPAREAGKTFTEDAFEGVVILGLDEKLGPGIPTIQGVVDRMGLIGSLGSWHDSSIPPARPREKPKRVLTPFLDDTFSRPGRIGRPLHRDVRLALHDAEGMSSASLVGAV